MDQSGYVSEMLVGLFDPLSSNGIFHALQSGYMAVRAIEKCRLEDEFSFQEYESSVRKTI